MAAITATNVRALTDKAAAYWLAALGTDASALGLRTVGATAGAYQKAKDLETLVIGIADTDQILTLLSPAQNLRNNTDAYNALGTIFKVMLEGLNAECLRSAGVATLTGVNDLDGFATYYNVGAGGAWNCLLAPDFRELFYAVKKSYPNPSNVYFEVLQGATYTNGVRKLVVGTGQTAGQGIDPAKYAGGFAQVNVSGLTGSGNVTVTGTWRAADGTTSVADSVTAVAANGVTVLTPPTANALLLTCTAIVVAAGITAGTIYVEAKRPAGRTNPPT